MTDRHEAAQHLRHLVRGMEVPTFAGRPEWYDTDTIASWLHLADSCYIQDGTVHKDIAEALWGRDHPEGPSWDELPDSVQRSLAHHAGPVVDKLIGTGALPELSNGLIDSDGVASFSAHMSPALALLIADLLDGEGDPDLIAKAVLDPNAEGLPDWNQLA